MPRTINTRGKYKVDSDWRRWTLNDIANIVRNNLNRGSYGGGRGIGGGAGTRNWNLHEYETDIKKDTIFVPDIETFNQAFNRARRNGLDTFEFNNKIYTTEIGDNPNNNAVGNRRTRINGLVPIEVERKQTRPKMFWGAAISGAGSGLSGAATGASVGSMFGPLGTGIGAGVGGAIGLITGIFGHKSKEKQLKQEAAQQDFQNRIQTAAQLNAAAANTEYADIYRDRFTFKLGGNVSPQRYKDRFCLGGRKR